MAMLKKYENISIQPVLHTKSTKETFELPNENLSEAEMARKSTSDRTKRRVAHKGWFPLPIVKKPVIVPAKLKKKDTEPKHDYEQSLNNSCFKIGINKKPEDKSAAAPPLLKTTQTPKGGYPVAENSKKRKYLVFDSVDNMPSKKQKTVSSSDHSAEILVIVDKKPLKKKLKKLKEKNDFIRSIKSRKKKKIKK